MAVKGNLQDMSLVHIISINCNEQNQARLLIRTKEKEAAIYFEGGKIVHANLDSKNGEDAIYELLTWKEGEFELKQGVSSPMQTVTANWSSILLEGLRRIDESKGGKGGFEVDWNNAVLTETKNSGDEIEKRMARGLKRIAGIEGVLICSREGKVISQDTEADPVREAALTALIGIRAEGVGVLVNTGMLKHAVLGGTRRQVMIINHDQHFIGLSLDLRTSVENVNSLIQMTMRRYR